MAKKKKNENPYAYLLSQTQKERDGAIRLDVDAYLAGFFDGEGHISIRMDPRRPFSCYVDLGATQVDKKPLELFVKLYGGVVRPKGRKGKPHWKKCFVWKCSQGSEVLWALYRMLPWLIVKRERARVAMMLLRHRPHFSSGGQISKYQKKAVAKILKRAGHIIYIGRKGKCPSEESLSLVSGVRSMTTERISA